MAAISLNNYTKSLCESSSSILFETQYNLLPIRVEILENMKKENRIKLVCKRENIWGPWADAIQKAVEVSCHQSHTQYGKSAEMLFRQLSFSGMYIWKLSFQLLKRLVFGNLLTLIIFLIREIECFSWWVFRIHSKLMSCSLMQIWKVMNYIQWYGLSNGAIFTCAGFSLAIQQYGKRILFFSLIHTVINNTGGFHDLNGHAIFSKFCSVSSFKQKYYIIL